MNRWTRPAAYVLGIGVIAGAYFLGIGSTPGDSDTVADLPPDPGYAARDAQVIETGYDGRERYRLNAALVRQQSDTGIIELEQLEMQYHPAAQADVPGEQPAATARPDEVWNLRSDRGLVRADGDDVELSGNVEVTGPAPGSDAPLQLTTDTMRINTPTEFIETDAPVTVVWSGHKLTAVGMQADLKAGKLSLESDVHGEFSPQ
jgi:LPS export ABC transporter protein LptC